MQKVLVLIFSLVLIFLIPNKVLASAPIQNNSSYTTPSAPAPSDGTSTETISIHLQDSDQKNVVGSVITLSSSNNANATFPKNNQTTDASGNASFTVATTTPGEVKITMFDSTNNVTFTDWFSITFYDSAKGCINNPPAPVLNSVVSTANNKATVTWTNVTNPVSNYLVSFGLEPGKYIYGDPNVGGQGTTTYTAASLTGNKKYYFAVAANNNCGRSGFSNEMSVTVLPIPSTPRPPSPSPISATPTPKISISPTPAEIVVVSITPEPEQPMVASVSSDDLRARIRKIGIGIMGVGVALIITSYAILKIKQKNEIPQIAQVPENPTVLPPPPDSGINLPK